jgi:NADPH:quinone reductase-like Zn-dependent oxidoreductase
MEALGFNQFGTPSVLYIEEVARPEPGSGEVLVQIQAAAVNASDVKNVAGQFSATTQPRTPGRDFSGVVVAGPRYEGKQVWSSAPGLGLTRDGVHAEYAVVPAECLSLLPATLTPQQASVIGVPFITAWVALKRAAKLQAGETILIVGASGAVGQAATQIAISQKARVLAAATSSAPVAGAEAVIDTAKEDVRERVLALTDGRGVDVVLDTVGGQMFEPALRSLRIGGRHVAITSTRDRRVSFDLVDFYHHELHLIGVDSMKLTPREVGEIADELRQGFESGALRTHSLEAVPFSQAVTAYEAVARGQSRAKYVLTF